MNKSAITFIVSAILGCGTSCANNNTEEESPLSEINEPTEIEMTVPIPQNYFNAAANQGIVEIVEYDSKDYTGSMIPTRKPAYVYLPYGYESSKKYNIIYLMHG